MHPLTLFFNYLKRIDFALVLSREHIAVRALTEWYPSWMYELMETDESRTRPYFRAIASAVVGKTVLELGTGRKALLAVFCAKAGAGRVYAVEANQNAYEASRKAVQSGGVQNVELIFGFSDKVDIEERCDVLVHDLVGDVGSCEGMVPFIADARRRLLNPAAIHIPRRCTTYVVLAEDPELSLAEWTLSYLLRGFKSFDSLTFVRFFGFPQSAALTDRQIFEDLILDRETQFRTQRAITCEINRDGILRGLCLSLRLQLSEEDVIDTWESQTSWSTPYIRFGLGTPVRKGDLIDLIVESDLASNPSYAVKLFHDQKEVARYAWSGD